MKMGNIVPRVRIKPTSLAYWASVLTSNNLGSLMSPWYPRLPVYAAPCLIGQCRLPQTQTHSFTASVLLQRLVNRYSKCPYCLIFRVHGGCWHWPGRWRWTVKGEEIEAACQEEKYVQYDAIIKLICFEFKNLMLRRTAALSNSGSSESVCYIWIHVKSGFIIMGLHCTSVLMDNCF